MEQNRLQLKLPSLVKIGEASKVLDVSIKTLRRWEKKKKISPIYTPGGTRLYSLEQLGSLKGSGSQDQKRSWHISPDKFKSRTYKPKPTSHPSSTLIKIAFISLILSLTITTQPTKGPILGISTSPATPNLLESISYTISSVISPTVNQDTSYQLQEAKTSLLEGKITGLESLVNTQSTSISSLTSSLTLNPRPTPQNLLEKGTTYTDILGETIIDSGGNIYPAETTVQPSLSSTPPSLGTWDHRFYGVYANGFDVTPFGNLTVYGPTIISNTLSTTGSATFSGTVTFKGSVALPSGEIGNSELSNSSITVNATSPLGGGAAVALGGSLTLTCANCVSGVTDDTNVTGDIASNTLTLGWSGQLGVARGGTALSTVAAGSILGANTLDTLSAITSTSGLKALQNSDGTITWAETTGTGSVVYSTSPSLTTPTLGVATATSVNSLTITSSTGTLTIPNSKTISFADAFTTSGAYSLTLTTTGTTNVTLPTTGTLATLAGTESFSNKTFTGDTYFPSGIWSTGGNIGIGTTVTAGGGLIVNTGNVGIGTTAPGSELEIYSTDSSFSGAKFSSSTAGTTYSVGVGDGTPYNDALIFISNTTQYAFMNSLGNWGYGFAGIPGSRLSASGNLSLGSSYVTIAAPTNGAIIEGNVGIGTTNPGAKLHLYDTAGTADVTPLIIGSDEGSVDDEVFMLFQLNAVNDAGKIGAGIETGGTKGYMTFHTGNLSGLTESVRINGSGNVGIGTTAPAYKLDMAGAANIFQANVGSNLITGWTNSGGNPFEVFTSSGADITDASNTTASGLANSNTYTSTVGKLYKVVVNLTVITPFSGSGTAFFIWYKGGGSGSGSHYFNSSMATTGTYTFYATEDVGGSSGSIAIQTSTNTGEFSATVSLYEVTPMPNLTVGGNVGIGTTNPGYTLSVNGTASVTANTASNYAAYIQNAGNNANRFGLLIDSGTDPAGVDANTNYLITFRSGEQTDEGSIRFTDGTVTYGAFTANHDVKVPEEYNASGYPYGTLMCSKSTFYNTGQERGIKYDTEACNTAYAPNVLGAYAGKYPDKENLHEVYVLGDGHILVNNEAGDIEVGDLITTSLQEGIGMKATKPGWTIGVAQESYHFEGSETAKIAVQYGLRYNVFGSQFALDSNGILTVKSIKTENVSLVDNIAGPVLPPLDLKAEIASLSARLDTLESSGGLDDLVAEASTSSASTFSSLEISESLRAMDATISGTFKALGESFLGNTTIAGDLTVDGTLSLTGDSLNSVSTLYIQNSALSTLVDIFNGKVKINKEGAVTLQKLVIPSSKPEGATNDPTVGSGTIPAGQTNASISNNQVEGTSKIFVTPRTKIGQQSLVVDSVASGSAFTVSLDHSLSEDTRFDWWVIGSSD